MRFFAATALLWIAGFAPAFAAQPMTAVQDDTPVFEAPNPEARVLRRVFSGTPFAASNAAIEGYYKVKTSDGVIGFVLAKDVSTSGEAPAADSAAPIPPTVESASPEVTPRTPTFEWPQHELKLAFGPMFYAGGTLQSRTGASMSLGWDVGAEYRYQWKDDLAGLVRLDLHSLRGSASNALGDYSLSYFTLPVSVGAAYDLFRTDAWRGSLSALFGIGLFTRAEAELLNGAEPNITTLGTAPFVQTLKADLCRGGHGFRFCAEGGWRGFFSSSVLPTVIGNGYQLLELSGTLEPLNLGQSGFFLHVGAAWGL